jgi:hypothetical protein
VTAAEMELRQATETGREVNQVPGGRLESIRTEAPRSDATMHADEFQRGLARDAACNLRGSPARRDPDEDPLPPGRECGELRDLARGLYDDAAHAVVERGRQVTRRLGRAVEQDASGGESGSPGNEKLALRAGV